MTSNPLARSRLKDALKSKKYDYLQSPHNETIIAALEALLNPKATGEMIKAGFYARDLGLTHYKTTYKAMISELTKEDE